jgi:hypothetical protein
MVVLLDCVWLLAIGLIGAAWLLVRYIAYDAWEREIPKSGGTNGAG